jgi:serine/threonine protein kinase
LKNLFDALNKDAWVAWMKGDYRAAGALFARGGNHEQALKCYFKGEHYEEAAALYEERGQLDRAGDMLANSGQFKLAGEMTAKAAAAAPEAQRKSIHTKAALFFEKADLPLLAGENYEKAGNAQKAVDYFVAAGATDKAASIYAKLGDKAKAAGLLEESLKKLDAQAIVGDTRHDPNQPRRMKYWKALADLYAGSGQPAKAAQFYLKVELKEKAAEALMQSGKNIEAARLYLEIDNYEIPARLLSGLKGAEVAPLQAKVNEHYGRHEEAGWLYVDAKNSAAAAANFEKAGLRGEAAKCYSQAGEFLKAAKLYADAKEFTKAGEMYLQEGESGFAADMFEKGGDMKRAVELYLKIDRAEKAADLMIQAGQSREAMALLQKVPPGASRYSEVSLRLGQLFLDSGEPALAAERFEKALEKIPVNGDSLGAFYSWGRALEGLGNIERARQVYESVLNYQFDYRDVKGRLAALSLGTLPDGTPAPAASRYRMERQLATEPLYEIWEGSDLQLNRRVKIYRLTGAGQQRERLLAAAQSALALHQPNVEMMLDVVPGDDLALAVAEMPAGEPLAARMARGPLPLAEAIEIARQTLRALAAAHEQKIIHGGLSPARISVAPDGAVKVGGFGFIERAEEQVAGNPAFSHYLTPEQFTGDKLDARADQYLFGLVLKYMLLGQPGSGAADLPWEHTVSDAPDLQLARLPPALSALLGRCLKRKREERYPSTLVVLAELDRMQLLPGMVISGRYEVQREIATGGMGQIFQVKDRELDEIVVLKILRESAADEEIKNRFTREIKVARRITHPYIVRVFDLDHYRDNLFITMEFVEGLPLGEFIKRGFCKDLRRPIDLALKIAQGMEAAHQQGVIHRDLKPLNILIDPAGNPKILDFGIAKSASAPGAESPAVELTQAGQVFGSPKYMSPEQCQGQMADGRTDIYSYGAILYYMFTGREAFDGTTAQEVALKHLREYPPEPRQLNPLMPPLMGQVIMACLQKDRAKRPGSFTELIGVLAPIRQQALAAAPAPQATA